MGIASPSNNITFTTDAVLSNSYHGCRLIQLQHQSLDSIMFFSCNPFSNPGLNFTHIMPTSNNITQTTDVVSSNFSTHPWTQSNPLSTPGLNEFVHFPGLTHFILVVCTFAASRLRCKPSLILSKRSCFTWAARFCLSSASVCHCAS